MMEIPLDRIETILCIGAHADDIEIGCGGTLLTLLKAKPGLEVHSVVLSATPERAAEAERAADLFLEQAARKNVRIEDFQDAFFPYQGAAIKALFQQLSKEISPDLILTHRLEDRHQDHRLVAELTWNAFRNHLILEYEIPKYEGDLGRPNVYFSLTEGIAAKKINGLMECFPSQQQKPWFCPQTLQALPRIRGLECNSPSGFAEAFTCRKLVLSA